jgi:hypothetical protein
MVPAERWDPPTADCAFVQVAFGNTPTRLEHELLPCPCPALAEAARDGSEFAAFDIVQHHDVRASLDGLIRLLFVAHFNVEEK